MTMGKFQTGEHIELREIWDGRIWEVRNAFVVKDEADVIAAYTPPSSLALVAAGPDGARLRLPPHEWDITPTETPPDRSFLAVHPTGTDHSTILIRDGSGRLLCWYINLETALRRTATGFEYTDHFLDVVVEPDLSRWRWKDEDELAEAVYRGLVTPAGASVFYAEGERAVERLLARRPPYNKPWEEWRPAGHGTAM
jgi:hypothetical protein